MEKVKYGLIGFGGIAENRIAKEGFACDKARFAPLKNAELVGAYDIFAGRTIRFLICSGLSTPGKCTKMYFPPWL